LKPLPTATDLSGVVTTSGAARLTASFTSSTGPHGAPTCSTAARVGNTPVLFHRFVVATGSGGRVYAGPTAMRYHGPGVYVAAATRMDDLAVVIGHLSVDFRRTARSTMTMTVRGDASGTATFAGYTTTDGRTLSGTIRWTCRTKAVA
jgi:hypothetical protein